ncbi:MULTISPECIES: M20 family metallopeptidase [unclassified Deinococcus]|uniref:M20 family metallopeptidase n=1 Tax=unclassified Deinococcus TaxID=2623546 RepID=UPI000992037D|nr:MULTISPECIES: M20 family metallopeptidase [unclassified Deinococcus]MCD0165808.1 amidohydrolase [Deinococcus sp. 12RED42]OOV14787.1 N-acyl-L-amino acid amidohydrolase [Deinococcus sp. LM3]
MTAIQDRVEELRTQLVAWRRHLHMNPEVGFEEHETAAYIEAELRKMPGLSVSRPTATSVLAVLKGGQPGRTVLLRADIDALPIHEENTFEFASTRPGVMHACGHDGHTAILLGVAALLSGDAASVPGEVRMIFQHAEEIGPGGAEELVMNTPLMDGVDVVTGLHLNSQLPAGVVAVKPGAFMAAPDMLELTIRGRGGHGAHPEEAVDPIAVGAQVVTNLQHVVSRMVAAQDALVVSITKFTSGTTHNVIPDTAELMGTVRTFDPALRERAPQLIERVIKGVCDAHGATYDLRYEFGYRPLINTDWVAAQLKDIALDVVGADLYRDAKPTMGGEDFSAYLEKAPGAYFNVGSGSDGQDSRWPHHHPRFTIDEASLETGVRMLHAAALRLTVPE